MCSLSRSISTSPGIRRSPVNSAKVFLHVLLQVPFGANARIHFHAAGQVQVAIDLGFGAAHLQGDRVIDPIAHLVTHEGAIGNRRREREGCRIERSEEHTSELQSLRHLVCRLLLEKKKETHHNRDTWKNTSAAASLATQHVTA